MSKPSIKAMDGERAFYNRIKHVFMGEDHLLGYYQPKIIDKFPDYLLLSPKYGIVIVEIKDYIEKYLKTISKTGKWEHETKNSIPNPFDQISDYYDLVQYKLSHCRIPNDIKIPVNILVVFSKISHDGDIANDIREKCPSKVNLCFKETLSRNEKFRELFNDILPQSFKLSDVQFNHVRANLIPSSRLPSRKQVNLNKYFTCEEKVILLEKEQEKIARELGEGHRLIFGVAGSGKTVILIARARFLAQRYPDWKILILCFNKLLENQISNMINSQDYDGKIFISTFHRWARNYILSAGDEFSSIYYEANEKAKQEDKMEVFFQDFVPKLLKQMIQSLGDKRPQYDAILIDEAQDFDQAWFEPIMQVLNPKTNSLLITCDGLQGIYARKRFTWSSVGIQAKGRVKRFDKSYRIPIEIGIIAQKALPKSITNLIGQFDEFMSTKQFIGNHGTVEIFLSDTRKDEYVKLGEKISHFLKNPQEILVLFKLNMRKIN